VKEGSPNPVDVHVGGRLRMRRRYLDMTQSTLAHELGLTFQQIQKYERGSNRISASRLFDLTRILDVPVSFFFDDMPEKLDSSDRRREDEMSSFNAGAQGLGDPTAQRETLELVKAYYSIEDLAVRRRIYEIMRALAADASVTPASEQVVLAPPPAGVQENDEAEREQ
jgi:transcriptional regulator with XRE-family HTH domain